MLTMTTRGQRSVCFSCGQPLPDNLPPAGEAPSAAGPFPLTGAVPQALTPPPNPYGAVQGLVLEGPSGTFALEPGVEIAVGRDPGRCAIVLSEPRVSALHAHLRLDGGKLFVRDEGSNNGTHVGGQRVPASVWTEIPHGTAVRFGPVELRARRSA